MGVVSGTLTKPQRRQSSLRTLFLRVGTSKLRLTHFHGRLGHCRGVEEAVAGKGTGDSWTESVASEQHDAGTARRLPQAFRYPLYRRTQPGEDHRRYDNQTRGKETPCLAQTSAWLRPWLDFPRLQSDTFQYVLDRLYPPDSPPRRKFWKLNTIQDLAQGMEGTTIASEPDLRNWQNRYIDLVVGRLCAALGLTLVIRPLHTLSSPTPAISNCNPANRPPSPFGARVCKPILRIQILGRRSAAACTCCRAESAAKNTGADPEKQHHERS